jgi:hypothetical protein
MAGVAFLVTGTVLAGDGLAPVLVLWAVGQPLLTAAWVTPGGQGRRRALARVGCLVPALLLTLLLAFLVLSGMAMGEMIEGI